MNFDNMSVDEMREWLTATREENKRLRAIIDDTLKNEPPPGPLGEADLKYFERLYGPRAPLPGVTYGMTSELLLAAHVMRLLAEVRRLQHEARAQQLVARMDAEADAVETKVDE